MSVARWLCASSRIHLVRAAVGEISVLLFLLAVSSSSFFLFCQLELKQNICVQKKCISKTLYLPYKRRRGAVKTMCSTLAPVDCSLLWTVKIKSHVQYYTVYKSHDCRRISGPSLLQGSNVLSRLGRHASDCVGHRRTIHKCRSATQQWISHLPQMMM